MIKGLAILIAGFAIGAVAAAWLIGGDSDPAAAAGDSVLDNLAELVRREAREPRPPSVSERLDAYRNAAGTGHADLETALARLADLPDSAARDLELDAALARLADIEAARAAALAQALGLDRRFLVRAFQYWTEADARAALSGLAAIASPALRREVAIGLLDVPGHDARAVAAALPPADRQVFDAGRIGRRAEHDPFGALRETLALGDTAAQRAALDRVALAWAEQDPLGALRQAGLLPDNLRAVFERRVVTEWARLDAAGFLAYAQSGAADASAVSAAVPMLAASDPNAALRIAEALPGDTRSFRLSAINTLAEQDPAAAMAYVDAMPAGQDRDTMRQQVGSRLAQRDPDAALAWAGSLEPPSPEVMSSVLSAIARTDLDLAAELLADPPPGLNPTLVIMNIASSAGRDPDQAAKLADRLLGQTGLQAASSMERLMSTWIQQDEESALAWLVANGDEVNASVVGNAAQSLARRDPVAAAGYIDRLPPSSRGTWMAQVAGPYAAYDPAGAMGWLAQYRGQDGYDVAFRQLIVQSAQADPRAAAGMLSQAGPTVQLGAASQVASVWARQDPQAAARWADGLSDAEARASAVGAAVSYWAGTDAAAARSWALGLRPGDARDQALTPLVTRAASSGDVDRGVLDAFSSDRARQQALSSAIPLLARTDAEEARQLLEREITDLTLRRQTEERLEQMTGAGQIVLPSGGVILRQ